MGVNTGSTPRNHAVDRTKGRRLAVGARLVMMGTGKWKRGVKGPRAGQGCTQTSSRAT